ncbi:MAG: Crp/Fnr family transcriptional regulator [Bacillota bacterium]
MNVFRLLKKNKFFYNFDDKDINAIFDTISARIVKQPMGKMVAKVGDSATEICIVLKGTLLKFVTKPNGKREALGAIGAGDMFGYVDSLLPAKELRANYCTAEDSDLLFITIDSIIGEACIGSPHHAKLIANIMSAMAESIASKEKDTEYLVIKSMRMKIAKLIYEAYLKQQSLVVYLGINRNEMAEYLNVSRPSMSREMIHMASDGIFTYRKDKIEILDLDKLKAIVESK